MSNDFRSELDFVMRKHALTPSALASLLQVDPSYIRRILAGARVPVRRGDELITKLSSVIGLDDQQISRLRSALSSAVASSREAESVANLVDGLLSGGTSTTGNPLAGAAKTRWGTFSAESALVLRLADLAVDLVEPRSGDAYIFTPEWAAGTDDVQSLLIASASSAGRTFHMFPRLSDARAAIRVLEGIFNVSNHTAGAPSKYIPVEYSNLSLPLLFVSKERVLVGIPLDDSTTRALVVRTRDPAICSHAVTILRQLTESGHRLVQFVQEGSLEFQVKLDDVEQISTRRFGIFDEGFSVLTHPPSWYGDNAEFETRTPWFRSLDDIDRREYKQRLVRRLGRIGSSLSVEEVVSEKSILDYLSAGYIEDDFYSSSFSVSERKEHVEHIVSMITDPQSRYSLYIDSSDSDAVSGKSWIGFDNVVSFGKSVGGENLSVFIDNGPVTAAFSALFEGVKRNALRRYPDPRGTADWLLARSAELLK